MLFSVFQIQYNNIKVKCTFRLIIDLCAIDDFNAVRYWTSRYRAHSSSAIQTACFL
jgi:hypothetical protein